MTDIRRDVLTLVHRARLRVSSEAASCRSRLRSQSLVEQAMNPMRRTPRTDLRVEEDVDAGARRIFAEMMVDALTLDRKTPGILAAILEPLDLENAEMRGRAIFVTSATHGLLPMQRWAEATGRAYRGRGKLSVEADLARIERLLDRRQEIDPESSPPSP